MIILRILNGVIAISKELYSHIIERNKSQRLHSS